MPTVYCLTGYPGAGKSSVADIAADLGFQTISMGDIVRREAHAALGPNATDDEIGEWADDQRGHPDDPDFDPTVFARPTVSHLDPPLADDWVIDGIRSPAELDLFESAFDDVIVIEVTAPDPVRRERITSRGRNKETADELAARDAREERWGLAEIVARSDVTIPNDGSLDDLTDAVTAVLTDENNTN